MLVTGAAGLIGSHLSEAFAAAGWEVRAVDRPGADLSQARAKQTLLPLLLFPLIVPVLLASVKATSLAILGDPMEQGRAWALLLVTFDGIYWSLCGLLFDRVVED